MFCKRKQSVAAAALIVAVIGLSSSTVVSAFLYSPLPLIDSLSLQTTHSKKGLSTTTTTLLSSFAGSAADDDDDNNPQKCNNDTVVSTISNPSVTAQELRQITVTNANGASVRLGDMMNSDCDTSIVVFLRHLGCFHCWSYARDWTELLKENSDNDDNNNIDPIFVSIGDENRLNAFLDKHPGISRSRMVVDGYDFEAYRQAGFGRFDDKPLLPENIEPKPITLGGVKGWWTFLTSFMPLAPVTPDMEFPEMLTPEGLFWVGGTLVIRGDEIVYRWDDRIAGDHPDAAEVLAIAKEAASTKR